MDDASTTPPVPQVSLAGAPPTNGAAACPHHKRTTRTVLPDGTTAWQANRYEDVRTVLSDPRFSADDQHPGYPHLLSLPPVPGGLSFLRMDQPRHDVIRRVLTPRFTVRRIESLRPDVERMTAELLDGMEEAGPPVDLIEAFALPLPSLVICRLLGVPYENHAVFQEHSRNMVSVAVPPETALASSEALEEYLRDLTRQKRARPGDDLISDALAKQEAAGMSETDIVSMARLMLIAGHETTANMIGMSMLTLFHQPHLAAQLRGEPESVRSAVEELMRGLTVVRTGIARVALEDVALSDQVIAAGEGVVIALHEANHDSSVYADPDTVDFHRESRGHVGFGYGIHQCIGQALARMELQVALNGLLARFPRLAPAIPLEEVRVRDKTVVFGVHALPVQW